MLRIAGAIFAFAILVYGALWLLHSLREPELPRHKILQKAAEKHEDCRDLCEQTQIVEKLGDDYLVRCRARCDAEAKKARDAEYEPIERITVAPADHRPPVKK